ncbi:MAG: hypothetical protein U0169_19150 [Polyangiaceae bacterium]
MNLPRSNSGELLVSGRSIGSILAEARVPTPAYVYDLGAIVAAFDTLTASFDADPPTWSPMP